MGKETEVIEEPTQPETETPETEVPTTSEPNPLEAELQTLRETVKQKEDSYKGLQTKLNQVNKELKERSVSQSRLDTLEQTQRILVAMMAERENITNIDEIPQEKKTDYLKKFDEVINGRKQAEFTAQVRDYQERTEALKLDPNSEEYEEIKDLVLEGKFARADKKIAKLEAVKETEMPEPKIDLEAERTKIREEERKKLLIERGELNAETGQPTGTSLRNFTREQIKNMSLADYAKNKDAIEAAREAGRIK